MRPKTYMSLSCVLYSHAVFAIYFVHATYYCLAAIRCTVWLRVCLRRLQICFEISPTAAYIARRALFGRIHRALMPPRRRQPAASDPPPALPGDYKLGEKVFYTAANQTLSNGDKVVHGQQGEVTGPATAESVKGKGVNVRFPGNKGKINCYLTQARRLRAAPAATHPACDPHS